MNMKSMKRYFASAALSAVMAVGGMAVVTTTVAAEKGASAVEEGKKIAFSRKKGNCLACHMMGDGTSPGNIAPPLLAMQTRFADKEKLRAQIWDPAVANKETSMPPFGKHQILSEKEIDAIVEYVWTL